MMLGCGAQQSQEAMEALCRSMGAQRWKLSYGVTAETGEGMKKTINLVVEDIAQFDIYQEKGSVTSVVALKYVALAGSSALEGYDLLSVDAAKGGYHVKETFSVADVQLADSLLEVVSTFIDLFQKRRYESLKALNDDVYLPDSTLNRIVGEMVRLDSVSGPMHDPKLLGFGLGQFEDKDLAVAMYRFQAPFGSQDFTNIEFQVNCANKKLSFVGVHAF